jgi:hypothetical protein
MAAHKGPASSRSRWTRSGSSVAAIPVYQCTMSLKNHFLNSHLNFFLPNLGAVSYELGKRYHQDISSMETRYTGKWSQNMVVDYCRNLTEEVPIASCRRMSYRRRVEWILNVSAKCCIDPGEEGSVAICRWMSYRKTFWTWVNSKLFSHFCCVTEWKFIPTAFWPIIWIP